MTQEYITIKSSIEITEDLKQVLEEKLKFKYPSKTSFKYEIDTSILVGLVVKVDDIEFNYNLRDQVDFILMELLK